MYLGFQDISIRYGRKEIISHVTLEFEKGKTTTIIGANGCGKTSLLKTISHAVRPCTGQVILEDKPLSTYTPKELAKKIAYLPQVHYSPADIDVRTLISYGRYPYQKFGRGLTREDTEIIDEVISLVGLERFENRLLDKLSGGERQRTWIAMTLCQQPEILIMDEPITYLDIGHQIDVLELVRDIGKKLNITIVMVLHDINLAARYSDCLYSILDRKVHASGTPQQMVTESMMEDIFSIDAQIFQDERNHCPFMIAEKRQLHT